MYSGSGYSDWEIGDITVIIHKGVYHLFHLIIPNHDYIAHAVSKDGISWKRTKNSLFVGHPGAWDDDMLWTMHVCQEGKKFVMYYTGLQRKDRGAVSRLGLAESTDLLEWKKIDEPNFFLEPEGPHYESMQDNPRKWLSFRDPFRYDYKGEVYLLLCTRSSSGPISRRGCVGLVNITNPAKPEFLPPLLYPHAYDDVECPCVFELHDRHYLLGSIREDIKVRYWFAPDFLEEYHSFQADVLLPNGNYAARTLWDGKHLLLYNFFYTQGRIDLLRVLPPPKQLDTDEKGRLLLKSYYKWDLMVTSEIKQDEIADRKTIFSNPTATWQVEEGRWVCRARSGYEVFCFPKPSSSFIWEGQLTVEGMGKLGIVSDIDDQGSGYFISLDVSSGLVQIRAWGYNASDVRQNFIFNNIQSNVFATQDNRSYHFRLIRYGHYIEFSINGIVKLTLMDYTYTGSNMGLYSSSSIISLENSVVKVIPDPEEEYGSQEQAQSLLQQKEMYVEPQ